MIHALEIASIVVATGLLLMAAVTFVTGLVLLIAIFREPDNEEPEYQI